MEQKTTTQTSNALNCGYTSSTEFRNHLKTVSEEVKLWPEWKQNILGEHTTKPQKTSKDSTLR